MNKFTKLFALLRAINKADIKELSRFVFAFYSEKKQNAAQLYHLLQALYPNFHATHPNMQVDTVCKLLNISDSQLNYVASDLVEILEDYFSYKMFSALKKTGNVFLSEAYQQKGLLKYIPSTLKQTQIDLARTEQSNDKRLLYRYWNNEMLVLYTDENQEEKKYAALKTMFQSLNDYYIYQLLTAATSILNDKLFKQHSYELPPNLDAVLQQLEEEASPLPVLMLYCNLIKLFQSEQELQYFHKEQYDKLKNKRKKSENIDQECLEDIEQHKKQLYTEQTDRFQALLQQIKEQSCSKIDPPSINELQEWYRYTLNFCYLKYNAGNEAYLVNISELYELMTVKQLLLNEQQEIDAEQYRNIIKMNAKLKRFDFCKRFASEYRRYLPEEVRHDAYHYSMALVCFLQLDYDDTLSHLRRIQVMDISYKVDIDALEIACYYEKDFDSLLESKLNSFSLYLDKNKKITATSYFPYKRFIDIVKRLWQIKNELQTLRYKEIPRYATKDNLAQLKADIAQLRTTDWLYQKAEELSTKIVS